AHLHRKERWAKVSGFSFAKTEKTGFVPVFSLTLRRMDIPTGGDYTGDCEEGQKIACQRHYTHRPVAGRNGHLKPDQHSPALFTGAGDGANPGRYAGGDVASSAQGGAGHAGLPAVGGGGGAGVCRRERRLQ